MYDVYILEYIQNFKLDSFMIHIKEAFVIYKLEVR